MAELDKVIKGLERCIRDSEHIDDNPCFKCPYSCQCQEGYTSAVKEDALELLKEYKQLRVWAWHAVKEQDVKLG